MERLWAPLLTLGDEPPPVAQPTAPTADGNGGGAARCCVAQQFLCPRLKRSYRGLLTHCSCTPHTPQAL